MSFHLLYNIQSSSPQTHCTDYCFSESIFSLILHYKLFRLYSASFVNANQNCFLCINVAFLSLQNVTICISQLHHFSNILVVYRYKFIKATHIFFIFNAYRHKVYLKYIPRGFELLLNHSRYFSALRCLLN